MISIFLMVVVQTVISQDPGIPSFKYTRTPFELRVEVKNPTYADIFYQESVNIPDWSKIRKVVVNLIDDNDREIGRAVGKRGQLKNDEPILAIFDTICEEATLMIVVEFDSDLYLDPSKVDQCRENPKATKLFICKIVSLPYAYIPTPQLKKVKKIFHFKIFNFFIFSI